MRLRISGEADRDIDELHSYGMQIYGQDRADKYVRQMLGEFRRISEQPHLWRERDEVRPPVRLRALFAHNIFYDVGDDEVVIVRVLHHTADWVHIL